MNNPCIHVLKQCKEKLVQHLIIKPKELRGWQIIISPTLGSVHWQTIPHINGHILPICIQVQLCITYFVSQVTGQGINTGKNIPTMK